MSELKALAHDVTKNSGDVVLYEKEYIQLQEQFAQITTEKFNGINLFSPTSTPDPLFVSHPERGDTIQVSRPSLGDLNTGETLKVGTFARSSYQIVNGTYTWSQAKTDAISKGGQLATVGSLAEWNTISAILPGVKLWLGATDEENEGTWKWLDGTPFSFSNWAPGEPNNDPIFDPINGQDYLAMHTNGVWDDWNNNQQPSGYVLEKGLGIRDIAWSDLHSTIQQVANARAQNGAEQMQLQMAADLNATNTVNLEQALSRIQDVDIAQVTSDLARTKVLIEAGTAMLAQANQSTDSILKLITQN